MSDSVGPRCVWLALGTAFWLSLEYLALGPFSWMYGYGAGLETIPVQLALAKSGSTLSLWAPFVAGGLDRLSFWGNADPLNVEPLLFGTLPTWLANGLHMFLQRFVAIYFTIRVCREQLRLGPKPSVAAGVLHGSFSYSTVGDMFALAGVPLLIWVLERISRARRAAVWALVAGSGFSILTTFTHSVPYLAVFTLLWFSVVMQKRSPRLYGAVACFFIGLVAFDSPQMLAALYSAPWSQRAGFPLETVDTSFLGLLYLQMQFDFFDQDPLLRAIAVCLPPSLLVIAAVIAWRQRRDRPECVVFLRIAFLYSLLSLRFLFIGAQRLVGAVFPWVAGVNMIRFHTIPASFLVAIIVTMGFLVIVPLLRSRWPLRRVSEAAFTGLVLFLLIWPKISLFYPLMINGWGQKDYEVRTLDELARPGDSLFRVASVLPLQPAYAYAQGFETADGWANLYPRVYRDLWLRVLDPLFRNAPRQREIFDPPGGRPQDHYIFLGGGLVLPGFGDMPGEDPARALVEGFDFDRRFNLRLLSLLNVKYLLSEYPLSGDGLRLVHAPSPPPGFFRPRDYATGLFIDSRPAQVAWPVAARFHQIAEDLRLAIERRHKGKDIYVYENLGCLPRYRFVRGIEELKSRRDVLDRLSSMTWEDLRETAVVETGDSGGVTAVSGLSSGAVKVEHYSPDEIRLSMENPGNGFLVIENTWNPFWRAEVDGQPRALVRANHAQFGLVTWPGERHVSLWYAPPYAPKVLLRRLFGVFGHST